MNIEFSGIRYVILTFPFFAAFSGLHDQNGTGKNDCIPEL